MFHTDKNSITEIGTYSLGFYFIIALVGVVIDLFFFSQKLFSNQMYLYIGIGILILATLFIGWSMHTGSRYRKHADNYQKLEHHHLKKGAFRFTRNPNYIGLGLLVLGLGFFTNSFAIVVAAIVSFIVVNSWFIPHEEKVLEERHGEHFENYKKSTRRWF